MGMTIDTVNQWLKIQRQNLKDFPEIASDKKIESLDTAISYLEDYQQLMRKYQKIEEIINDRYGKPVFKTLDEVIKVVEDGNEQTM